MTFFRLPMTEKIMVEARERKYRGVPGYGGWSGPRDALWFARFSRVRACVRGVGSN